MTDTSKTKGFLTPVGATPVYDNDPDTVFRHFIAGVTGLDRRHFAKGEVFFYGEIMTKLPEKELLDGSERPEQRR